jgi:hypothetical protein
MHEQELRLLDRHIFAFCMARIVVIARIENKIVGISVIVRITDSRSSRRWFIHTDLILADSNSLGVFIVAVFIGPPCLPHPCTVGMVALSVFCAL